MAGIDLWRIAVTVPEALASLYADALGDHAAAVATFELEEGGDWLVEATSQGEPDRAWLAARVAVMSRAMNLAEPELVIEPVQEMDWLTRSYGSFPPIRAGRFFIHGSHHDGAVPAAALGLLVDAATAFGTGEHPTTRGCLEALSRLAKRHPVRRALDMGCGSGILAMAAARLWRRPVVAVDIDPESVHVARENARLNRLGRLVQAFGGNGYRTPEAVRGAPYDLIAANILARPLARMAPDLKRHLAPGGYAVLSGLLVRQERHVLAAHRAQGLALEARIADGDWLTLILRRRA